VRRHIVTSWLAGTDSFDSDSDDDPFHLNLSSYNLYNDEDGALGSDIVSVLLASLDFDDQ